MARIRGAIHHCDVSKKIWKKSGPIAVPIPSAACRPVSAALGRLREKFQYVTVERREIRTKSRAQKEEGEEKEVESLRHKESAEGEKRHGEQVHETARYRDAPDAPFICDGPSEQGGEDRHDDHGNEQLAVRLRSEVEPSIRDQKNGCAGNQGKGDSLDESDQVEAMPAFLCIL